MAKKSSTVHLEESTWKEIKDYQEENGGIGRNEAIERMLTERRLLIKMNLGISKKENDEIAITKEKNDKTTEAINSVYDDMPD